MALFNFKPKKKKPVLKKNMNWSQAKAKYPKLSPFGDADRDGVKNWLDCKPFDKRRQDDETSQDALNFAKEHDWGKDAELENGKITNLKEAWSDKEGKYHEKKTSRVAKIKSLREFGGY